MLMRHIERMTLTWMQQAWFMTREKCLFSQIGSTCVLAGVREETTVGDAIERGPTTGKLVV